MVLIWSKTILQRATVATIKDPIKVLEKEQVDAICEPDTSKY